MPDNVGQEDAIFMYVVFFIFFSMQPHARPTPFAAMKTEEQCVCSMVSPPLCLQPTPPFPEQQNNKAGDVDDKGYWGMARPTHLLVHHTVCTVILNKDQRETTGD